MHFQTDALILSRVLHDWEDEKALKILTHCKNALKPRGTLYILEILQNDTQAHLLSLNMLAICKSYERTLEEYQILLKKAEFNIKAIYPLNNLQKIIVCQ